MFGIFWYSLFSLPSYFDMPYYKHITIMPMVLFEITVKNLSTTLSETYLKLRKNYCYVRYFSISIGTKIIIINPK